MPDAQSILFTADLGGDVVYRQSTEDAEAIRRAAVILDQNDDGHHPRPLIEYLSALLRWYGRDRASRTLEERHLRPPA